jgi:hypothetical protein
MRRNDKMADTLKYNSTQRHTRTQMYLALDCTHTSRLPTSLTKQVHPQPSLKSQKQLSFCPNYPLLATRKHRILLLSITARTARIPHILMLARTRTVNAEYFYTRYNTGSNMVLRRP